MKPFINLSNKVVETVEQFYNNYYGYIQSKQ